MARKYIIFLLFIAGVCSFLAYHRVLAANVPPLKEGTYLTGQTLSVWPSWSVLGGALGQALPVDPINRLVPAGTCASTTNRFCLSNNDCPAGEACILHDRTTGWSTVDRRFSFACNPKSYAYRYIVAPNGSYMVRANLEDTGIDITDANFNNFVASFISTSIFRINESSGVCNADEEIATLESGTCGDGRLNLQRGEQCDPPGKINYFTGCDSNGKKNLTVCNSSCQWVPSTTPCGNLSRCGNGQKEFGETCDEGALNGRYNHCNITCTGSSPLGRCGNGVVEPVYEICDSGTPGREKYDLVDKNNSCSWDCQNWGPYCGDKIVQSQHGEECDSSQVCSIGGRQGTKACSNKCKREDKDVIGWWSFDNVVPGNNQGDMGVKDSSSKLNHASCLAVSCPRVVEGKIAKGMEFSARDFNERFLIVPEGQSLEVRNAITVEAWVNPSNNVELYQRVVEQGGAENYTGFDLELNASSTKHTARFNLWNGLQTGIDSESSIPLNMWTHIAATYERVGDNNTIKMYVNGTLEGTKSFSSTDPIMGRPTGDLFIGKSASGGRPSYFFGSLDEVKIYPRVLSADEVHNNFQTGWLCAVGAVAPPVVADNIPASCGNSIVETNEACDRGVANNGQACTASYGQPCSYCSANCQNVIDVQPREYCGNGVIEQREKCDTLSPGGIIYVAATNTSQTTEPIKNDTYNGFQERACAAEPYVPHTLQKGTKTCGDCAAGVVRNCIRCGIDPNGIGVSGGVINVLATSTGIKDPLFTKDLARAGLMSQYVGGNQVDRRASSSLNLAIGTCRNSPVINLRKNLCDITDAASPLVGQLRKGRNDLDLEYRSYALLNPYGAGNALINSNPACSEGNDLNGKYVMYINQDWSKPLSFPVVASPQTWQYDLVLSPVIDNRLRNKDMRVVVSWVAGEFYGGIINPFVETPDISAPAYCNPPAVCAPAQKRYATGLSYYSTPNSQLFGVWYHGLNSTEGHTQAESFTINTANMSGNTYSFYVRSPSSPIRQFRNTARLKVEIFLPEAPYNPSTDEFFTNEDPFFNFPFRFGAPVKIYYFNAAAPSDNPNAKYWQVFNVNKPDVSNPVSVSDIMDVSAIFTGPAQFRYVQ